MYEQEEVSRWETLSTLQVRTDKIGSGAVAVGTDWSAERFLKEESTEAGELLDTEEKGWGDSEGDGKHGGGTITA